MLTVGPTSDESRIVGEHFEYCSGLVDDGTMLLAGRTVGALSETIGIIIIHAESDDDASQIVGTDPAVLQGVMAAEIQPYRLALLSENPQNM